MESVVEVIRAKRDGLEFTDQQIRTFLQKLSSEVEDERVHDSQIGAFLMAIFLNGLSPRETELLTKGMTYSGYTFEWPSEWKGTIVDKHSTGGVGDKVSLILAPALAACGLRVPMISGRGLDFTGGTLDKLESIPGFVVTQSPAEIHQLLETVGACIVGQTAQMVPADRILYRTRDTTATVDNRQLIVASIISKKAAEGLDALVLDVKCGSGALMKDIEEAQKLALNLVQVGNTFGMKVSAFITNMDIPLGRYVGNALEVVETIETLRNNGPSDLLELIALFGGKLLESTGKVSTLEEGQKLIQEKISNGSALAKFEEMIIGQGTLTNVAKEICHGDYWKFLPKATNVIDITSPESGFVSTLDALLIAKACHAMGCGRTVPGSSVKLEPGVVLCKKPGDPVTKGETLMKLHYSEKSKENSEIVKFSALLLKAVSIAKNKPNTSKLILDYIQ